MVFKTTKGNVRSGNTLRATSCHRAHGQPVIIRTTKNVEGHANEDDILEGYVTCGNDFIRDGLGAHETTVPCSLKKKGRWQLTDILSKAIVEPSTSTEDDDNNDVDISLLEHHLISHKAHCVCITSTKRDPKRHACKSTYFNDASLGTEAAKVTKTTGRGGSARPRKRKDHKWMPQCAELEPATNAKNHSPSLRYDIFNAAPPNSQLVHSHKTNYRLPVSPTKPKRCQKHNAWNEMQDYTDAMYDYMDSMQDSYESECAGDRHGFTLEDVCDISSLNVADEPVMLDPADGTFDNDESVIVERDDVLYDDWEIIKCVADWAPEDEYNPPLPQ